ncbi:MAG: hypothetical protein ACFCUU_06955 [Cyclobacteriaceae bacterium]
MRGKGWQYSIKFDARFAFYCLVIAVFFSMSMAPPRPLYPILHKYARSLYPDYSTIPEHRKEVLDELAAHLIVLKKRNEPIRLVFYDYNQAVLAPMAQSFAMAAAYYYGVNNIQVYGAGVMPEPIPTETILTLERCGFIVYKSDIDNHDVYQVKYSFNLNPQLIYAKKYDYKGLPVSRYLPVVLQDQALSVFEEKAKPWQTVVVHYQDPGGYVETDDAIEAFDRMSKQIALEMFYVFWHLKKL